MILGKKDFTALGLAAGMLIQGCTFGPEADEEVTRGKKEVQTVLSADSIQHAPIWDQTKIKQIEAPLTHTDTITYAELRDDDPQFFKSHAATLGVLVGTYNANEVVRLYNPELYASKPGHNWANENLKNLDSLVVPHIMPSASGVLPDSLETLKHSSPEWAELIGNDQTIIVITQDPDGIHFVSGFYIQGVLVYADRVSISKGDDKIYKETYTDKKGNSWTQRFKKITILGRFPILSRENKHESNGRQRHVLHNFLLFSHSRGAAFHYYSNSGIRESGTCVRHNYIYVHNVYKKANTVEDYKKDPYIMPTNIIFYWEPTLDEKNAAAWHFKIRNNEEKYLSTDHYMTDGKLDTIRSDHFKKLYEIDSTQNMEHKYSYKQNSMTTDSGEISH